MVVLGSFAWVVPWLFGGLFLGDDDYDNVDDDGNVMIMMMMVMMVCLGCARQLCVGCPVVTQG